MNEEKKLLFQLQIVLYLVKEYGYGLIEIIDRNTSNVNDFYLVNNKNKEYSIIRVSNQPFEADSLHLQKINSIVGKLINNYQNELSIFIGEGKEISGNNILISDNSYSGLDVSKNFPELKFVVHDKDNRQEEIVKITEELKSAFLKNKAKMDIKKKFPIITYLVIVLCILFYGFINFYGNKINNVAEAAVLFGAYYKPLIMAKEYFRFITVGLVHINFFHLMVNMVALYNLGKILEPLFGHFKFFVVLILSNIGGSVLSYIIDYNVLMTGISGGLFGLFGLLFVYFANAGIFKNPEIRKNLIYTIVMNILISLLPNVALYAHLGGFLVGVLISFLLINNKYFNELKAHVIFSIFILTLILFYKVANVKGFELENVYLKTDQFIIEKYRYGGFNNYADKVEERLFKIYNEYWGK